MILEKMSEQEKQQEVDLIRLSQNYEIKINIKHKTEKNTTWL